jgi:hypothetical protein
MILMGDFIINVMVYGMLFLVMFGFHCLADYPLQGEFLAVNKSKNLFVLLCHCATYAIVVTLGFLFLDYKSSFVLDNWLVVYIVLFASHILIDITKCNVRKQIQKEYPDLNVEGTKGHKLDVKAYYIDQAAHMVIILILLLGGGSI